MTEDEKKDLVLAVAKVIDAAPLGTDSRATAVKVLNVIPDLGYGISKPPAFPRFYYETIVF